MVQIMGKLEYVLLGWLNLSYVTEQLVIHIDIFEKQFSHSLSLLNFPFSNSVEIRLSSGLFFCSCIII